MTAELARLQGIDLVQAERELCKRHLADFIRRSWHVLEPGTPYVHGWHVDALCEHLEAVTKGQITRLLINVPPGTMKSTASAVYWPSWEWGPQALPHTRIIGASHGENLAIRDARKMRNLVQSQWYQERWPIRLASDQNLKTAFENDAMGFRAACAVKSMTGQRGHRVIWDDPHSVEAALSVAHREVALRVFQETLPTRMVDPERSAIIIIMQRLHENDVSGHILASGLGYEHLCLPMEYEQERRCVTSIGFADPRTEEGELLFPARFPRHVVERDKKVMGNYAAAGQFQQRPAPRTGGFFEWDQFEVRPNPPAIVRTVRYWDKAATEGGGCRTAGVKMGVDSDGVYWVLDVVMGQWGTLRRESVIKQTAQLDGYDCEIWLEEEGGSGGKDSAAATVRNLAGFTVKTEHPTGSKEARATPYSVQVAAGNVKLVAGPWSVAFVEEHKTFPVGKFKDQIDAASGGFNKLASGGYSLDGVT